MTDIPRVSVVAGLIGVVWLVFVLLTGTGGFEEFPCFW